MEPPVPQERFMYILDASKLKAGDIIFTRDRSSATSWGIRAGSWSRYSHAILYVDSHSYIDSDMHGVHSNNLQYLVFPQADDVAVRRLKAPAPEGSITAMCDYARSQIGQQYSITAALGSIAWFRKADLTIVNRQFCSRLVAMAYATGGVNLVRNPMRCTPNRVFRSSRLVRVPDACRGASIAEMHLATRAKTSIVSRQEEITNRLFEDVRAATSSNISTFEGIVTLVAERPENDASICSMLTDSGYLSMWMDMRAEFPEWYDAAAFAERVPAPQQAKVADDMYASAMNALERRRKTAVFLQQAFSQFPRKTIAILLQLELKLHELEGERVAVAERFRNKGA